MCKPVPPAATISASKEGVKFSVTGDMGTGNVTVRQNAAVEKVLLAHIPTVIATSI